MIAPVLTVKLWSMGVAAANDALPVEPADVADDPEQLGGEGELDARLAGDRYGAQDAFLGAAVASSLFGVLAELGCRPGQCLSTGGAQSGRIGLERPLALRAAGPRPGPVAGALRWAGGGIGR